MLTKQQSLVSFANKVDIQEEYNLQIIVGILTLEDIIVTSKNNILTKMVNSEVLNGLHDSLIGLSNNFKSVYNGMKQLPDDGIIQPFVTRGEEFIKNETDRLERFMKTYDQFASEINSSIEKYQQSLNAIEEEERKEVEEVNCDIERIKGEMDTMKTALNNDFQVETETHFVYNDNCISKGLNVDLVKRYPGSYYYKEYMSKRRTHEGDVFIDRGGDNDELIVKYMKNDKSLNEDIKKMKNQEKTKLIEELCFLELPVKNAFVSNLSMNRDAEIIETWKNRKMVYINGKLYDAINKYIKENNVIQSFFDHQLLKNIHYSSLMNMFYIDMNMMYPTIIEDYLLNGKINPELIQKNHDRVTCSDLIREMEMIGIKMNEKRKMEIINSTKLLFMQDSTILLDTEYDSYLEEWTGYGVCTLIYRASEHGYTAESFHQYCDDKGPTLVLIKSSEGWIFGGYTTQSWSGNGICFAR